MSVASSFFLYFLFKDFILFLLIKEKESSYRFPKISFFISSIFKLFKGSGHFAHFDKLPYSGSLAQFFKCFFLGNIFGKLPLAVSAASQARQNA